MPFLRREAVYFRLAISAGATNRRESSIPGERRRRERVLNHRIPAISLRRILSRLTAERSSQRGGN